MEQKLYQQMTVEEQLRYVTDLTTFVNEKLPVLERIGDAWEMSHRKDMETGLELINAFMFAREFVEKARRYGDYAARVHRLRVYINKVKDEISKGLSLKGSDGRTYAIVSPSVPARRRGRPSAAEIEARKNGIQMPSPTDPEKERQIKIAQLMGFDVMISDKAPREKNNAEVAAEKAARKAEYEKQNPSLFPEDAQDGADGTASKDLHQEAATPPAEGAVQTAESGLPCPTMSEVYQDRIEQDRLRLSDLAWLCSEDLKKRIETVRGLRVTAESASERAKTMAEMGAAPEQVEPYAQQAKEAVEGYMAIYAAVDEELAIVFKRLSLDIPYQDRFKGRFRGVDIEKVLHITRPYYEKVKRDDPTIDERIKQAIETDNPEYAAKMKAEEARKEEISDILRYLKRKDKMASDTRLKTAKEVKFPRLVELVGEEEAKNYYPYVQYIEDENAKLHAAETPSEQNQKSEEAPAKPKTTKDTKTTRTKTVKAATKQKSVSKREKRDAGISVSEREQTRHDSVKAAKKKDGQ